jgi:hypothetical protein
VVLHASCDDCEVFSVAAYVHHVQASTKYFQSHSPQLHLQASRVQTLHRGSTCRQIPKRLLEHRPYIAAVTRHSAHTNSASRSFYGVRRLWSFERAVQGLRPCSSLTGVANFWARIRLLAGQLQGGVRIYSVLTVNTGHLAIFKGFRALTYRDLQRAYRVSTLYGPFD